MKKKIIKSLQIIGFFAFVIGIYVLISVVFSLNDCGTAWDLLKENKNTAPSYALPTLIVYRILIYLIPALLLFSFEKIVVKDKAKKAIVDAFNIQFVSYAIVAAIWRLAGMDYYVNVDLFSAMDSFVLLVGLVLSVTAKVTTSKPFEQKEE